MASEGINGIINVLKPPGMTSHDVIYFLRRLLHVKKAGHTGTLDPGVAGVLPVCLGKATKTIEYRSEDIKYYRAEAALGRSTTTQDSFGETIASYDASGITEQVAAQALQSLVGYQSQIPPMVSALKINGRKLCDLAREGIEVERQPRTIQILEVKIIKFIDFGTPEPRVLFDIACSKGTYIRTICHDIGEQLGCGGYMSFLIRTGTGSFHINGALTLEELGEIFNAGRINEVIQPLDFGISLLPVWIHSNAINSVKHGNPVFMGGVEEMPEDLADNQLVKLMNREAGCLAAARLVSQPVTGGEAENSETRYCFQPVKVFS